MPHHLAPSEDHLGGPLQSSKRPASNGEPSRSRITRVSKACENCRTRRIKCEPPFPCEGCRSARLTDCHVRSKARPGRQPRQEDPSKILAHTGPTERIRGLRRLEQELERVFEELTGVPLNLVVPEILTHTSLDLSSPLPALPQISDTSSAALREFERNCLPFCSFLSPSRIQHLFERYSAAPNSLSPDQAALVCTCLACGYVRLQHFDEVTRKPRYVAPEDRQDVAWYRHAVKLLDKWGSATFTSLHALSVMWFYTSLVSSHEHSRFVVSWIIAQARELGLHSEQTALAAPSSPTDRADLCYFIVLYAHYYAAGLGDLPPIIKPGEFDTVIFPTQASTMNTALVARRPVLELTLLNTQLMMNLHDDTAKTLSVEWLLRIESRWARWMTGWIKEGRTSGTTIGDPLVGVLWDWGRILLRAAVHEDERFSISSYAMLARSAVQILSRYRYVYENEIYNLVWQHWKHILTCAHIVLLCFWRYELTKDEAEQNLSTALWLLKLAEPRWGDQARMAREKIESIAGAFGVTVTQVQQQDAGSATTFAGGPPTVVDGTQIAQSGFLFTEADFANTYDPTDFDFLFFTNDQT